MDADTASHLAGSEPCDCLRDADHGPLFGERFPHTLVEAEVYVRRHLDQYEDMAYGPSRWDVVRTILAEYDRRGAQLARQAPVVEAARRLTGRYAAVDHADVEALMELRWSLEALSAAVRELDQPEVGG